MSGRRGGRLLRAASRLSMLAGVMLFAAGLSIRAWGIPTAAGGVPGAPTPGPGAVVALSSATPSVSASPADPMPSTPAEAPGPTLSSIDEVLFADAFDTEAAWPTGPIAGGSARYADGAYVVDARPIDLPGYVYPAAGEGSLPEALTVSATFELDGPEARAGLVVRDADGTSVGALLSADGRVILVRDSIEAFDVLGSGSADAGDGPIRVSISVDPAGTSVALDGRVVVSMQERVAPVAFGLAIWSQLESARVVVDQYEVRAAVLTT